MWEEEWENVSTTMDDRGRVLIPKDLREAHGLQPGAPVIIESAEDGVRIRPALPKDEALDRLAGVVNASTRRGDAEPGDPLEAKEIWEPSP